MPVLSCHDRVSPHVLQQKPSLTGRARACRGASCPSQQRATGDHRVRGLRGRQRELVRAKATPHDDMGSLLMRVAAILQVPSARPVPAAAARRSAWSAGRDGLRGNTCMHRPLAVRARRDGSTRRDGRRRARQTTRCLFGPGGRHSLTQRAALLPGDASAQGLARFAAGAFTDAARFSDASETQGVHNRHRESSFAMQT